MRVYKLNPFATFVESHLVAGATEYAIFHRLTGRLLKLQPAVRAFLQPIALGTPLSLVPEQLSQFGEAGQQVRKLIDLEVLLPEGQDPFSSIVDYYVNQPLQNPAVTYEDETGEVVLVSISMAERVYSPEPGKLPSVNEEKLSELPAKILLAADGTKTLRQIYATVRNESQTLLDDYEFRAAIELLSMPDRQLIKFVPTPEGFADPFYPANIVPGNFYHGSRWSDRNTTKSIADFHAEGIEDALWEFDIIEPTVNHALRFPSELLAGLDYGTRFCDALIESGVAQQRSSDEEIAILEVGGGTGSFARSFIPRAQAKLGPVSYEIMDLSPTLAENQRRLLGDIHPSVGHIIQDATEMELPGRQFDLIVSNEVIADFPVAVVERLPSDNGAAFNGPGAAEVDKYSLVVDDAPGSFYVNSGVFQFLERAWAHLKPGGTLVLSEYGSKSHYPVESFHLNHSEFTIHFGHVEACARKIGYETCLKTLTEFLRIDDSTAVLNGREEHILCLNHVLLKYGLSLPFALFSERDFRAQCGEVVDRLRVRPIRFMPLSTKFHYGPSLGDFFLLVLKRPVA